LTKVTQCQLIERSNTVREKTKRKKEIARISNEEKEKLKNEERGSSGKTKTRGKKIRKTALAWGRPSNLTKKRKKKKRTRSSSIAGGLKTVQAEPRRRQTEKANFPPLGWPDDHPEESRKVLQKPFLATTSRRIALGGRMEKKGREIQKDSVLSK